MQYPALRALYVRDNTNGRIMAEREFKYIHFICDRDSFCVTEGFSDKEAHAFAKKHSGMPESYKPDKFVMRAIDLVKELNGGVIEEMIDATVSAFRVDAKLVKHVKILMENIGDKLKVAKDNTDVDDLDSVERVMKLTDAIINISNAIPSKIEKLLKLREEYDNQKNKVTNTRRGGGELTESYDGRGIEEFSDTGEVERLD